MREIKFRAYNKAAKKMIYTDSFSSSNLHMTWDGLVYGQGHKLGYDEEGQGIYRKDLILMQYTGVKDSKRTDAFPDGREIYEGDIVKKKSLSRKYITGVVKWNDSEACFMVVFQGGRDYIRWGTIKEVIGNIYENPDLLNND